MIYGGLYATYIRIYTDLYRFQVVRRPVDPRRLQLCEETLD